jgi:hypothetical protein
MQTNLLQGQIASQMNVAQLNADQQRAVQNAAMVSNVWTWLSLTLISKLN